MGVSFSSTEPVRRCVLRPAPTWLLCAALFSMAAGCVHRGRDSVVHFWGDFNTLNQPAFFIDKIHHQPPKSFTVDRFRWAYDRPPGGPLPNEAPFLVGDPTANKGPMMVPNSAHPGIGESDSSGGAHDSLPLPPLPDEAFPDDSAIEPDEENDGPTVQRNPPAEFASLRRRRSGANSAQESTRARDESVQPSVVSRPKGTWLFDGSQPVRR